MKRSQSSLPRPPSCHPADGVPPATGDCRANRQRSGPRRAAACPSSGCNRPAAPDPAAIRSRSPSRLPGKAIAFLYPPVRSRVNLASRVATNPRPAPPALNPEAGVGAERRWVSWACATTGFFSPLRGTPRATWCSAPCRMAWVAGSPGRRACAPAMASIASPAKGSLQPAFSPLGEAGRVDVPRPARCPLHYNEQGHSVLFPLTASIAAWRCSAKCSIPSTGLKPRRRRSVSFALRKAASTCGACPALVRA